MSFTNLRIYKRDGSERKRLKNPDVKPLMFIIPIEKEQIAIDLKVTPENLNSSIKNENNSKL